MFADLTSDLLRRSVDVEYLYKYLVGRYEANTDKSFVININAEWGYGKTHFLKSLANKICDENHPVFYFNSWESDYSQEPLLGFMSELENFLAGFFEAEQAKSKNKNVLEGIKKVALPIVASIAVKKLFGFAPDEFRELASDVTSGEVSSLVKELTQNALNEHIAVKKAIEKFKVEMKSMLDSFQVTKSKTLPMFLLIDELDRCRPTYAIELLENIKHIFDIAGIVFVVATDSKQLSHSIKAVYGHDFDSEKYLKRFFEQEYRFEKPNTYDFINSLMSNHDLLGNDLFFNPINKEANKDFENMDVLLFSLYVDAFRLDLRSIEQAMNTFAAVVYSWDKSKTSEKIHLGYLLFLIALKQYSSEKFDEFVASDSDKKKKMFSSLNMDDVSFWSYQYNELEGMYRGGRNVEIGVKHIIALHYVNIWKYSRQNLYSDSGYEYIDSINQLILNEAKFTQIDRNQNIQAHGYKNYHKLVLQAGRFS